jgi:hypothetical protein
MSRLFEYVIFVFQIASLTLFSIQIMLKDMKSIENYEEIYFVKGK